MSLLRRKSDFVSRCLSWTPKKGTYHCNVMLGAFFCCTLQCLYTKQDPQDTMCTSAPVLTRTFDV